MYDFPFYLPPPSNGGGGFLNGDIMPFFVPPESLTSLRAGWYPCMGETTDTSSTLGQKLSALPAAIKAALDIEVVNGTINLPTFFAADGRGYFLRAVDGTTRTVGSIEEDALQSITGQASSVSMGAASGAFSATLTDMHGGLYNNGSRATLTLDASLVARTSTETRALNIGVTYGIYLGA